MPSPSAFVSFGNNLSTGTTPQSNATLPPDIPLYLVVLNTYLVPVLFGLISVLGVAGNSLVMYVILAKERMRTITNLLLLNLAIADFSFVLVIPPFTAHQMASSDWPFGDYACRLMHYLVNVTAYVTVYTLVLVSAIRYMTVVHSVRTAAVRSRRNVVTTIVTIWAVMLVVNSPVLTSYGVRTSDGGTNECDIVDQSIGQGLFTAFFVFAYVLPLAVIAVFSLAILRHIHRHKPPSSGVKNRSGAAEKKKRQAGRMLIVVVVVFALSWMPVHIHILVFFYGRLPEDSGFYSAVSVLWYCLAYFNSCVNPIIYNHTSKEFRDAFREVVCRSARHSSPRSAATRPLENAPKQDGVEELLPVQQQVTEHTE